MSEVEEIPLVPLAPRMARFFLLPHSSQRRNTPSLVVFPAFARIRTATVVNNTRPSRLYVVIEFSHFWGFASLPSAAVCRPDTNQDPDLRAAVLGEHEL